MQQIPPNSPSDPERSLTIEDLRFAPPSLPLPLLVETAKQAYGIEGNFVPVAGERDQNLWVQTGTGSDFLLKVASPLEDPALIDFQIKALEHLAAQEDDLPVPHLILASNGAETVPVQHDGESFPLRILSFVPGHPLDRDRWVSPQVLRGVGKLLGRVNRAFQGFSHPAQGHFMPWDILNGLLESRQMVEGHLPVDVRVACAPVLERLVGTSLPAMRAMRRQVIHNDAHAGNLVIDPDDRDRVCGLIDFGDMVTGPIVQDMAVSLASLIEDGEDPAAAAIAFLEGFAEVRPLPMDELPYLHDAILARLILSVELIGFQIANGFSSGADLVESDLPRAISTLRRELDADAGTFTRRVLDAARTLDG